MTKEVDPGRLITVFSEHGEALDRLTEQIHALSDSGTTHLPADVEAWQVLTGRLIQQYDLARYRRDSEAADQLRSPGIRLVSPEAPGD